MEIVILLLLGFLLVAALIVYYIRRDRKASVSSSNARQGFTGKHPLATGLLIGFVGLMLAGQLFSEFSGTDGGDTRNQEGTHGLVVYVCAKNQVERMLKSPKSADFPTESYRNVTSHLGGDRYQVSSYVDAQNSFGAMVRSNYTCTVQYNADGSCNTECEIQ